VIAFRRDRVRFHLVGVTPLQLSPVMEGRKVEGKKILGENATKRDI
jgi:hypothetical protein